MSEQNMSIIKKGTAQAVTQTVAVLLSHDEIEMLARAIEKRSADKPRSTPATDWEEAKRRSDELRAMAQTQAASTEATPTTHERFGGCPHCGSNNGFVDIAGELWFCCDKHSVKWHWETILYPSWVDPKVFEVTPEAVKVMDYATAVPIFPEPDKDALN